jgi:hypothetical protein
VTTLAEPTLAEHDQPLRSIHRLVIRGVGVLSVLAASFLVATGLAALGLVAAFSGWVVGDLLGAIDRIEGLIQELGFDTFKLERGPVFRALGIAAGVFVLTACLCSVGLALVFNAVGRLMGGIRIFLDEEPAGGDY